MSLTDSRESSTADRNRSCPYQFPFAINGGGPGLVKSGEQEIVSQLREHGLLHGTDPKDEELDS